MFFKNAGLNEDRELQPIEDSYIKSFKVIMPLHNYDELGEILTINNGGVYCPPQSMRGYHLAELLSNRDNYAIDTIIEEGMEKQFSTFYDVTPIPDNSMFAPPIPDNSMFAPPNPVLKSAYDNSLSMQVGMDHRLDKVINGVAYVKLIGVDYMIAVDNTDSVVLNNGLYLYRDIDGNAHFSLADSWELLDKELDKILL